MKKLHYPHGRSASAERILAEVSSVADRYRTGQLLGQFWRQIHDALVRFARVTAQAIDQVLGG